VRAIETPLPYLTIHEAAPGPELLTDSGLDKGRVGGGVAWLSGPCALRRTDGTPGGRIAFDPKREEKQGSAALTSRAL